jgi:hypothetical protein
LLLVAALGLLAVAVRLPSITSPPLDFAPARQTYGALRARIIYLETQRDVEPWRREVLEDVRAQVPQIEPPVLEHLAAVGYGLLGSEQLWAPRLLSAGFWLAGAFFLFFLALRLSGAPGALVAVAVYLFLPFAILASRSFQPDPLMVGLTLAALLGVVRYFERPSRARLAVAIAVSASAILSKPPFAAFFLVGAFASLAIANRGLRRAITSRENLSFVALSLVPAALYYLYGVTGGGFLGGHVGGSIQPRLVTDPEFWRGWLRVLANVVAYPVGNLSWFSKLAIVVILAALAMSGLRWASSRTGRSLLFGLWIGYALLGLVFTVHVSTHAYYSLPLVPIIALSVAPLAERVWSRLTSARLIVRGAVALIALGIVARGAWTVENKLDNPEYRRQANIYERVGTLVDHTNDAVHVDRSFDTPLLYYAWISSSPLYYPGGDELERSDLEARIREVTEASGEPRFLIVTATEELARQRALGDLVQPLPVVAQAPDYAIYALRS